MSQLHKKFSDERIKQLLSWYDSSKIQKSELLAQLEIKDSQFYNLLKQYHSNPVKFTIQYSRKTANNKLPDEIIDQIRIELETDKRLIDNPAMPVIFYNYSSIRDYVVEKTGYQGLSAQTVINYAKQWGFYIERPKKKQRHTREVITDYTGMLLQHDSSIHQWSPYATKANGKPLKWSLITTLDDHSRMLLYADLFEHESAWAHIQALQSVVLQYGVGLKYYSDNHSIFRFVAHRDSNNTSASHYHRSLSTDDIPTQWKQCVEATGMRVSYALSPEAKGKVERPYRWLQDRIVRRSARQKAKSIDEVREVLRSEIDRYNNHQIHSTTQEIPARRYQNAIRDDRSCFKPLDLSSIKPPASSLDDIFCLRAERKVNGYGIVSFNGIKLTVPKHPPEGTAIRLHIIPDGQTTKVRFLKDGVVLGYQQIPTPDLLQF